MSRNRGFTLIELLVVVSIIGLLSSVVLASLNSARIRAQDTADRANFDDFLKKLVACDASFGKITTPNSATAPTNQFCTTDASLGTWPKPPAGWRWHTNVLVSPGNANAVFGTRLGASRSEYTQFYCGHYPGWETVWNCSASPQQHPGLCRAARTYSCTFYNQPDSKYE